MSSNRILYVTSMLPFPPDVGVRQRIFNVGRLLQRCGVVTLSLISRFDQQRHNLEESQKVFAEIKLFRSVSPATKGMVGKVKRLASNRSVCSRHGCITGAERERFNAFARNFDLIWFHTLTTVDMTGSYRIDHSVIDLDDLNSVKFKLAADVTRDFIQKAKLLWLHTLWKRWEQDALNRFSAICVCSQSDKERFRNSSNVFVIPNGFNIFQDMTREQTSGDPRLGFIGTLRYAPNMDSVMWFINKVLPLILERFPNARIRVVGELPAEIQPQSHPNVDWLDFVDDAGSEMSSWSASIVPLRIGGGTRIKILEALSRRCPIVSTTIGAYGLELENGRHLLIADTVKRFAESCILLLENKGLREEIAEAGWQRFVQRYTWGAIQPAVESVVMEVIRRNGV